MFIHIAGLKISIKDIPAAVSSIDHSLTEFIAAACGVPPGTVAGYRIRGKSIDARPRPPVLLFDVDAELTAPRFSGNWNEITNVAAPEIFSDFMVTRRPCRNPLVIGTGPAGLLAAYLLAKHDCAPLIIDRGFAVERRRADIDDFLASRQLNPDSNFLLGEGGAGTFSDGKLYTRIRNPASADILRLFAAFGAPEEILYLKHPHIGSDILPRMVKNIRLAIENMGGKFLWGRNVTGIIAADGVCRGVTTAAGERIEAPVTVIAQGLGGRQLTASLIAAGVENMLKDFQIGCRIEHSQEMIDRVQFGRTPRHHALPAAEYNLVSRPPGGGVAGVGTFCMCPGGEIVPSTAFPGQLSTNGMSLYARNGKFANSCLIVNQRSSQFADGQAAYRFLAALETAFFTAGGNDYSAPAQDAAAFVRGEKKLSRASTSYRFGIRPSGIDALLPETTRAALVEALLHFEKVFAGFMRHGVIIGVETYVSSPVRFARHPETLESSLRGLYIAGEGAGFAGGIMSAAADGVKIARKILTGT